MSDLSLLKWQCRRGTKELDLVLTSYLESYYQAASRREQSAFNQLLELEDPVLADLLLGNISADNKPLQSLVIKLRVLGHPSKNKLN
jgi:antitoxin CptB